MRLVIDVDYHNICKSGQKISGDVFLLNRQKEQDRIVCTLSDGLGSGVKANVLASLTATMGQKFVLNNMDITRSAHKIMQTLPVCSVRKISYATFSIIDISKEGSVRMISYDNPPFIWHRTDGIHQCQSTIIPLEKKFSHRKEVIHYSEVSMTIGDRLIFFSDGVSQSGMGTRLFPLGWRQWDIETFVNKTVQKSPTISSRELSRVISREAQKNDAYRPKDDITCAVAYFRKPRHTLLLTGAPFSKEKDSYIAEIFQSFEGKKIVSGGTTANIIARELSASVEVDLTYRDKKIPPPSSMKGADLISEGMLTLSRVAEILEQKEDISITSSNAATMMVEILLDSDSVHFMVGTKINEAHQNPDMPVEMGIRRTIVQRIIHALEENYLKETSLEYV